MKTVFNTLNIVYFILIIITVILLIFYINKFYMKKEKFDVNTGDDNLVCDYIYNSKVLMELCKRNNNIERCNTYITNIKESINALEGPDHLFVNDIPKKCEVFGNSGDTIIAKCCPINGKDDPKECVSISYSNIRNKNVL